ncbi:MAG: GNAT family N-acetyltransferase [Roseovarius sp.]|nr:GNAT family N-acetyltransferase [Roseovarius sp.]
MSVLDFRNVQSDADLEMLDHALRRLSVDLGDGHAADRAVLRRAVLDARPAAHGLLAVAAGTLAGAALFSPVFSTVRGAAGAYVTDLWTAADWRGQGVGRGLVERAGHRSERLWGATWLKLDVYARSAAARRFYEKLGFVAQTDMTAMRIDLATLRASGKDRT